MISRPSIGNIRSAWVDMFKNTVFQSARKAFASHMAAKQARHENIAYMHLVHVQDEVELRLLSGDTRWTLCATTWSSAQDPN